MDLSGNWSEENKDIWDLTKKILKQDLESQIFSTYIGCLELVNVDIACKTISIKAPSSFVCKLLTSQYKNKLSDAFEKTLGAPVDLNIFAEEALGAVDEAKIKKPRYVVVKRPNQTNSVKLKTKPVSLNHKYTFDTFVVGNNSQFGHAAAVQIAENPGKSYNPLFLYGGVGLGKTHLLHSIGNYALEKNPGINVHYVSSEVFTNELIDSLRTSKMSQFKEKYRKIDLLLIDDIQFLARKERTQEEFFHTFNSLYSSKRQIVITSDTMPLEIPGIAERLKTRFAWGLTADLQAPDFETRVAILKRKAFEEEIKIDDKIIHLIADCISSNVRELEGALTRIVVLSKLRKTCISLELARDSLREILRPKQLTPTVRDVTCAVSDHFGVRPTDLSSKRRTRKISFPRQIAMYLCRKHTTCSYSDIGADFGGRDHSSVIHAARVVSKKLKEDDNVANILNKIERDLLSQ